MRNEREKGAKKSTTQDEFCLPACLPACVCVCVCVPSVREKKRKSLNFKIHVAGSYCCCCCCCCRLIFSRTTRLYYQQYYMGLVFSCRTDTHTHVHKCISSQLIRGDPLSIFVYTYHEATFALYVLINTSVITKTKKYSSAHVCNIKCCKAKKSA